MSDTDYQARSRITELENRVTTLEKEKAALEKRINFQNFQFEQKLAELEKKLPLRKIGPH